MPTEQVPTQVLPKKPLISFIVTTYNTPVEMLADCLDSITCLSLSKSDREIIIVDDGSTDNSPQIIDDFKNIDNRIKSFHQKNMGQAVSRTNGMKLSKGDYILCVDSDDFIDSDIDIVYAPHSAFAPLRSSLNTSRMTVSAIEATSKSLIVPFIPSIRFCKAFAKSLA